jgi:two-component system, cell cycle response regulator CtrA
MNLPTDPFELQRLVERYKMRCDVLDRENDELRERLKVSQGKEPPIAQKMLFGLTNAENVILTELIRRESLSKNGARRALYSHRIDDNIPAEKIVDVFVCKMRKKLKRHGIEIATAWGAGYYLTPAMKRAVESLTSELSDAIG